VKRLPTELWIALVGCALLCGAWWGVASYGENRYEQGRRDVAQASQFDTAVVNMARRAQETHAARVDTLRERVVIERRRVDTLVLRVPDSLRTVPEVDALLSGVAVLTVRVDSLTRAIDTERAASVLRAQADSAAIVALRITNTEQARAITTAQKRPRWVTVFRSAGAALVVGFVAGALR
jgi:hypothetical protein